MKKEEEDNIVFVCGDCMNDERTKFHSTEHIIEPGDYVKAIFTDHTVKANEYMWVLVSEIIDKNGEQIIVGNLHNKPGLVTNVKYNDVVNVSYKECLGHIKDNSNEAYYNGNNE